MVCLLMIMTMWTVLLWIINCVFQGTEELLLNKKALIQSFYLTLFNLSSSFLKLPIS